MVDLPTEILITDGTAPPRKHVLPPGDYLIGSAPDVPLRVTGEGVAAHHARLTLRAHEWQLEILDGAGCTLVNGEKVTAARVVFPTQKIRIGGTTIALSRPRGLTPVGAEDAGPGDAVRSWMLEEILGDGKYQIGPVLGRGGMGVILDAHEPAAQRNVAMKLMLDFSRLTDIKRFVQEAQITAQLEHPNIPPVHELGVNELGQPFYTMKYVRGRSLGHVLESLALDDPATTEKYSLSTLLTLFQKVCDAVAFAHSKGVIHRDLKPANIMLGEYGEALVMDWGLAKFLDHDVTPSTDPESAALAVPPAVWTTASRTSGPTRAGTVMGSPPYMSPEQAGGAVATLDERTDIYSLGAILYHLMALQPPFAGEESTVLQSVREGLFVHPSKVPGTKRLPHLPGGRVPASLAAVVMKAMARTPADRYQTVLELQGDIDFYQSGFATGAEHAGAWKLASLFFQRHRAVSIAVALGLLASAFFVYKIVEAHARADAEKSFADEQRNAAEEHAYVSDLLDAGRHLAEGYPENARNSLLRHQQERVSGRDLRGWEWFYLLGRLNEDRLQVLAHPGGVLALAARADGAQLVTGGVDGDLAVWRTRGLRPEFRLHAHTGPVQAVAWHPERKWLASGGADGAVRVWDADSRQLLAELPVASVQALAWQPKDEGRPRLAIGGRKLGLVLWNPPLAGLASQTETLHRSLEVAALHWSADGTRLALGAFEAVEPIRIEDFRGAGPLAFGIDAGNDVFSIAFDPSGRFVAAGDKNLSVTILKVARGDKTHFPRHRGPVSALAWSGDGEMLATASHDRTIGLFKPQEPQGRDRLFSGHLGEINGLLWTTPAGAGAAGVLFSAGADGTLRAWRPTMTDERAILGDMGNWVATTRWSPDGGRLAAANFFSGVHIFTMEAVRKSRTLPTRGGVFDLDWAHSGDRLAVAARAEGEVEVLDAADGHRLGAFRLSGVERVAWSPSDRWLAAASPEGVRVWEIQTGRLVCEIPRAAGSIAWAADERRLAVGGRDGAVEIWDATTGARLAVWRAAPPAASAAVSSEREPPKIVFDLAWSHDGQWLAFVTQDSIAGLLSASDGRLLRAFTGHGGGIRGVSWSPDSRRLATCGADGFIFIFDPQTGDQVARIMRGADRFELHSVDWSPDGRQIVSGGYDGKIRLWDAWRGEGIDAVKRLEMRLKLAPKDLAGWRESAEICTRLGWASHARADFQRALELAPDDATLRTASAASEEALARATDEAADR